MKIVIPGGSGQVGTLLARALVADGHQPVILSRNVRNAPWPVVQWDGKTLGPWAAEIDGADVVINLAGRSVNCRYHQRNRRQIMDSRINSTRAVGEAIRSAANRPPVWLQASTATIYADRYDAPHDEATGYLGGNEPDVPETWNFSIDVAKAWEAAANESAVEGTRLVLLRSALTADFRRGKFDDIFRGRFAGFPRVLMLLAAKVSSRFLGWAAVFPPSEITGIFAQAAFYPCIDGRSPHFRSWDQRS